jgi:hypothetical protein
VFTGLPSVTVVTLWSDIGVKEALKLYESTNYAIGAINSPQPQGFPGGAAGFRILAVNNLLSNRVTGWASDEMEAGNARYNG